VKVILLAGGLGTRISEETSDKPKPMVLINERPIIWHLMNIFAYQGFSDFVIATGYKSEVISQWVEQNRTDFPWTIEVLDTGLNTQTGGRIKQCMNRFPGERVIATYGDGLGNVSIKKLIHFHENHESIATVTAVRPPARFGHLEIEGSKVSHFGEKNQSDVGWINGGFFILEPEVAQYIDSDSEAFELGALPRIVERQLLTSYKHEGFWQPMDTLREKLDLEKFALLNPPPWLGGL
jgi:glucose-1-phosphate cytidylyltransferase